MLLFSTTYNEPPKQKSGIAVSPLFFCTPLFPKRDRGFILFSNYITAIKNDLFLRSKNLVHLGFFMGVHWVFNFLQFFALFERFVGCNSAPSFLGDFRTFSALIVPP